MNKGEKESREKIMGLLKKDPRRILAVVSMGLKWPQLRQQFLLALQQLPLLDVIALFCVIICSFSRKVGLWPIWGAFTQSFHRTLRIHVIILKIL